MPSDDDNPSDDRSPDEVRGTVLSPDELDISEDQHVLELDDGRYLISPEERPTDRSPPLSARPERPSEPLAQPPEVSEESVHDWLAERLEAADSRYGFDITAVFEGRVVRQELFSNDVITTFENLLVWYAQHVGGDTPVEDVLGILLAESTAPIRLPPYTLESIVAANGLSDEATIADLLEAVRRDGGIRFPSTSSSK